MLMIELPTATPPLAMTAAYKETDVTIRIRPNRYYSAEYRIAVHPTIRPQSEYEANIHYSPNPNERSFTIMLKRHLTVNLTLSIMQALTPFSSQSYIVHNPHSVTLAFRAI